MTTLRRDARKTVEDILIPAMSDNPQTQEAIDYAKKQAEKIVDALSELKGFAFLKTDEEQPAYGFDLEESDIAWTILADKPVTQKYVNKQQENLDLEVMIDAQLTRLKMNWFEERDQEQTSFRKFIKEKRKNGEELEKWVNWWMSEEWRTSGCWKLETIRKQWNKAFSNKVKKEIATDESGLPMSY